MMESPTDKKWMATQAQTLRWCCFCDTHFKTPALLSRHLDKYNVNWKLYWRLFYSSRDGSACVLCNILHADRRSLECHFKMVHCITGSCAEREPEVITVEGEPSENSVPTTSADEAALDVGRRPGRARDAVLESEQGNQHVINAENIDNIDVLFEINSVTTRECGTPSVSTPESLHLALPCTSSEADESPITGDLEHMQENRVAQPESPCHLDVGNVSDGPEPTDSRKPQGAVAPPVPFAILHSDDEVEELETTEANLLAPVVSGPNKDVSATEAGTGPDSCPKGPKSEVININDDDDDDVAMTPFVGFDRLMLQPPSIDLPRTTNLPAESRHTRPTAVVNPFGVDGETFSVSRDACEETIAEPPSSVALPALPGSSQTVAQGSAQGSPVRSPSSPGSDLIAMVAENSDNSDVDDPAPSPLDPLLACNTPPNVPGDVEMEINPTSGNLRETCDGPTKNDLPDLGRLTPSKIALYMNKGFFTARHQSELDQHLRKKALSEPLSPARKELLGETSPDPNLNRWEATSEGGGISVGSHTPREQSVSSEPEADDEPLPFGLSIVSVESLLHKPSEANQDTDGQDGRQVLARTRKRTKQTSTETAANSRGTTRTRKRTVQRLARGTASPTMLSASCTEQEHSCAQKKPRVDAETSGHEELIPGGTKEVFKQPIGLCVGIIHAGSLVEVSTANLQMSTNTGSSLDGMVMKVETSTDASVRYFIHFPNMDKRLDRWVSKEDIIQVYRTEHDKNNQDAGAAAGVSSPPDTTKRRLAFDPSPGRHTRQVRKKVTGRVTAASKRSRSLTKPSKRGRVSAAQRRPKDRRGRLVRLAKERLIPTRQGSRKSDRNLTATNVLCPTRANVGDAVERSTTQMSSYPNKTLSLRSRQVRVAAETAQSSELRVVGDTENTTKSTTTSRCSDVSRGDSKGAGNSDDRRSGRQKPAEQARTGTGTGVERRPAGGTMDVKSNTASWSDGVANAGKWKQRCQPPPGVTVRPFVSSMADSLRPGMKLYVICTVINHGWLRLFSAVIKRVVARRQYHVHYLGFKSCHDELIAPDLIHSVIEVQGKAPVRQLQVPWLAKSTKETPDEPESAAATPPTLPRQCPPRRQRAAPPSQLDSPPSLVQEAKGRAVPDSCRTQTPKASAGASGAVSASPQSTGHAPGTSVTVPPAGRASVRAGRSGTAERAALSSGSLPGPAKVGKRRGRPPKKYSASKSKYSCQSPQSHAGVQAFDKDLQSSRTDEASATEEKQACLTERTATAVPAVRIPCADDSPTAQRLLTRLGKSKMGGGQLSDRHPKLTPLQQKSPSLQLEGSRPANGAASSASPDASDIVVRCTYSGSASAVCAGSSAGTPAEHTATVLQIKKRGRPRKKPSLQGPQSRLPRPDAPPEKCGASPSTSALTAPEESPRQRSASKSVGTEQRRPAAEPADQRRHRGRPLRSLTAASTPQTAAGVAEDVSGSGGSSTVAAPAVPPPRAAPSGHGRAAPTADAHVGASGPSDTAATPPNIPCLKGALGSLADGDVVYVVYGMMEDGTKVTYPAKVLKVDRQLYYARFHIHYLGWAHRYDEWIAEEVIYSVVDRNTPNFNVKALKRRLVPSSRRQEQLSVVRPCSVDLSVNNICFFSALSKDRARVNDSRIQTLGAATASGRPAGCS